MKAICFKTFGAASDVLETVDIATPEPGPGEVRIKLATSGVNPSDVKKRAGAFPNLLDNGFVIPHSDGAGVIDAVGSGVRESRVGERVFVYQAQHGRRFGTAAEYVCVDDLRAPAIGAKTGFDVAACFGIPVMTAHRCVFADGPVSGQTVLVTGGAGRVGHYAIQWAAQAGATVIATSSNPEDEALCRSAGAAHVVNHRNKGWAADVLAANGGQPVDRVVEVEFGANLSEILDCIRKGGVVATYSSSQDMQPVLPFYRMMFMDLTLRMVIVYDMPETAKAQAIADIAAAEARGALQHRIAGTYPLEDCARAHEIIETGKPGGAIILRMDGPDD